MEKRIRISNFVGEYSGWICLEVCDGEKVWEHAAEKSRFHEIVQLSFLVAETLGIEI